MSEPWNPASPPPPPMNPPGGYMPPPPMNSGNVLAKVQGPAIGLMVTGACSILYALYAIGMNLLGSGQAAMDEMMANPDVQKLGPFFRVMQGMGIFYGFAVLVGGAFLIWAALQMKQARKWNLSLAASIVAMVPCVSCCFIIGIPVGIWALVILMKPDVKAAFTA